MSIQVTDLGAAEVYQDATVTSRRVIRRAHGSQAMSFNVTTLAAGYADAAVCYPDHDEIVYVLAGQAELVIDGQAQVIGPGHAFFVPRGSSYGYRVLKGPNEVIAVFNPAKT